jgi:hypothetical protein
LANSTSNIDKTHDLTLLNIKFRIVCSNESGPNDDLDLQLSRFKLAKYLASGGEKVRDTHLGYPLRPNSEEIKGEKPIYQPSLILSTCPFCFTSPFVDSSSN